MMKYSAITFNNSFYERFPAQVLLPRFNEPLEKHAVPTPYLKRTHTSQLFSRCEQPTSEAGNAACKGGINDEAFVRCCILPLYAAMHASQT